MIRDPSDGSVRESRASAIGNPIAEPPQPTKEQLRMQRSREWLRDYHERKGYAQKSEEAPPSGLPD